MWDQRLEAVILLEAGPSLSIFCKHRRYHYFLVERPCKTINCYTVLVSVVFSKGRILKNAKNPCFLAELIATFAQCRPNPFVDSERSSVCL